MRLYDFQFDAKVVAPRIAIRRASEVVPDATAATTAGDDAIPAAVTLPLMRYIAALSCKAFGKGNKGYEADKDAARKDIAALKSTEQRPEQQAEYY